MGLRNELRAFVTAISENSKDAKKNKEALERIYDKWIKKPNTCGFCGNKLIDSKRILEIGEYETLITGEDAQAHNYTVLFNGEEVVGCTKLIIDNRF